MKTTLIITSFKEPKTIGKAIESALKQKTKRPYDVLVSAPDEETLNVAKNYASKNKKVKVFKDAGKGKMTALNTLFKKLKSEILILTDGDVYINDNAVEEILTMFEDEKIACITGRPVPVENKKTKYGYWANFLFDAAHNLRKKAFQNGDFIECSGYLFAFRANKDITIPLDTAEDAVIPYFFWEKGYKIGYASKAEVYVKNVDNWNDWIKQKVRTTKAHETLDKYVDTKKTPRVKSFSTEAKGFLNIYAYAKNLKEFYWSTLLVFARMYMWIIVFYKSKFKRIKKVDNWERINSTK